MTTLAFVSNLFNGPGLMILLLLALLFGAKRLPELGKSLGQTIREFSKGREENEDDNKDDPKKPLT